ncbi:MAG: sulfatase [bacterium]|nr:sulfatase [bacterium]
MTTFIRSFGLRVSLFLAGYIAACSPNGGTKQGNVVIIISDALRQDVIGCYGGEALTPNIDWLAQNGVVLENAYSNGPWTVPSCIALLTGNYPTSYGSRPFAKTIRVDVPLSERLMGEVLRDLGYATFARVDNLHAQIHGNMQGYEGISSGQEVPTHVGGGENKSELEEILGHELTGPKMYFNLYETLERMLDVPATQRIMMLYWMLDPHSPYKPIDRFRKRIETDVSSLPRHPSYYSQGMHKAHDLSPEERAYIRRLYVAEVESVDERVGYVIEVLRHTGRLDDTYIVFTSDHGEQLGERGDWGHGAFGRNSNYYEVLTRIPMIIAGPGIPKGKRRKIPVSLVDIQPTLKELLGVEYADSMQGRSFTDALLGEDRQAFVYFTDVREHDQMDALLENGYKLIAHGDRSFELYHLQTDPDEEKNLATEEPERVARMFEKIEAHRAENLIRRMENTGETVTTQPPMSDDEIRKTLKALKALGYM